MPLGVEKKFAINPKSLVELIKDAKFLGEKTFSDTYFDTAAQKYHLNKYAKQS